MLISMSPLVLELGDLGSLWLLFPSLEPRVSALCASSLCLLKVIAGKLHGRVVSKAQSDSTRQKKIFKVESSMLAAHYLVEMCIRSEKWLK